MLSLRLPLVAALAAAALAAVPAAAQSNQIDGTFVYAADRSDNVDQAINQAISRMNIATRQIARPRLRRTNQPYQRVTIATTPQQVSITTDARAAIRTSPAGTPIKWTREDGEVLDVSTRWDGNRLRQVFAADDGQRENVYSLSPDGGTLTIRVTVTSGRLPAPLTYNLVYDRVQ
jgi:hypothetical protein